MQPGYFAQQTVPPPMFPGSGTPSMSPFLNFGNLPGMSGPQGAMLQMVAQPLIMSMFGGGQIPGQFFPQNNLYDQHRKAWEYQAMQNAMAGASSADRDTYSRMLRGMALSSGVTMNADRERAIQMMSNDFTKVAPLLAQMMPETFDRMHGIRGSAMMFAQNMFMGGRYALDPVTGRTKMTADTVQEMAAQVHDRLYGPGADITEMRGVGAGRLGQLYDELQRRGMGVSALSRDQQRIGIARDMAASGGTVDDALKKLDSLAGPELESRLRSFEGDRVARRLKEMVGAVDAIRDVFGDMGQPDAPMSQLIEGLQAITQGGLNQLSPHKIEQAVRETANLARRTGMGMDNLMQLSANGAIAADRMGINRMFATPATQHAAAFSQAYGLYSGGPAWGKQSKEFMTLMDQRLGMQAAGSELANRLAVVDRLQSEVGPFGEGTEAAALVAAMRKGDTSYIFGGKTRSLAMRQGELTSVLTEGLAAGGMGRDRAGQLLGGMFNQNAYNERFTHNDPGRMALLRRLQGEMDLMPELAEAYRQGFTTHAPGVNAAAFGSAAARAILGGVDLSQIEDIDAVMNAAGLGGGTPEQRADVRRALIFGRAQIDEMVRRPGSRWVGYGSGNALLSSHNRRALKEAENQQEEARIEGRLQGALGGLGRGTVLQRLSDALQGADAGTSFGDVVSSVLGFQETGTVAEKLRPELERLRDEVKRYDTASGKDAIQIRNDAIAKIEKLVPGLKKTAREAGFELDAAPSRVGIRTAIDALGAKKGDALARVDDVAEAFLTDDRALLTLGEGGASLVETIRGYNRRLKGMTGETGGDLAALLGRKDQIGDEARRIYGYQQVAMQDLQKRSKGSVNVFQAERASIKAQMEKIKADGGWEADPEKKAKVQALEGKLAGVDSKEKAEREGREKLMKARGLDDSKAYDRLISTLGLKFESADEKNLFKESVLASGVLSGAEARGIREAIPALERLRDFAKKEGVDFATYLKRGPGAGASEEEKNLFSALGPKGKGLRGISSGGTASDFADRLREMREHEADLKKKAEEEKRKFKLEGTITVKIPGVGEGQSIPSGTNLNGTM